MAQKLPAAMLGHVIEAWPAFSTIADKARVYCPISPNFAKATACNLRRFVTIGLGLPANLVAKQHVRLREGYAGLPAQEGKPVNCAYCW
jgi:hypothetical protein